MITRRRGRLLAAATGLVLAIGGVTLPAHAGVASATLQVEVWDEYSDEQLTAEFEVFDSDPAIGDPTPVASGTLPDNSSVGVPAGNVWVTASAVGYTSQTRYLYAEEDGWHNVTFYLERPSGTLAGTVLKQGGAAYSCGWVRVYPTGQNEDDLSSRGSTGTNSSGQWSLNVPVGTYKVQVVDDCGPRPSTWAGGASYATATTYTVTADATTPVSSVTLPDPAVITGKVVDSANQPIKGMSVIAYRSTDEEDFYDERTTNSAGVFTFSGLAAGTYRFRFVDPSGDYVSEYYQDKTTLAAATPVQATVGATTSLPSVIKVADNVVPLPAPALTGKVTSVAKAGLRGVRVSVFKAPTAGSGEWDYVASTLSHRGGVWRFEHLNTETGDALAPGTYKLRFSTSGDDESTHETEWYNNRFSARAAQTITVNETGTVNAATTDLIGFGSISGKLTLPLSEASDINGWVQVRDADGALVHSTDVSETGAWATDGLLPGVYTLSFEGWRYARSDGHAVPYIRQFWKGRYSQSTAQTITVGDSKTSAGVNAKLGRSLLAWSAPKVTGKAVRGKTLSANRGAWNTEVSTIYRYQWLRSGKAISKATGRTYKLTSSDVGKRISVRIAAADRRGQFAAGAATSKATVKVKKPARKAKKK